MRRLAASFVLALFAVACAGSAAAPSERAHAVEAQVWSPYCPGRLLIDCTTSQARDLRGQILQRVEHGDDTEEIITWIRREFGNEAIARPSASGAGLMIWLVPALLFAIGLVVVARVLRRGRTAAGADV